MRATKAKARPTRAAALLLALLLVAPPATAETPPPAGHGRSKLTYVFPIAFVASFVIVGFVLVRAALSRDDDTARLRAATAKVDQALGTLPGGSATGTAAHHSRSTPAGRREARSPVEARLLPSLALRWHTD